MKFELKILDLNKIDLINNCLLEILDAMRALTIAAAAPDFLSGL